MSPELSIIIPCYNYAHYLKDSVESVLEQDYQNYELLLIDDGSSDNTWEIMQEYALRFPQVRIFRHEKNRGIFKSNQTGWNNVRGRYLHFFSADDLYHPNCLTQVMQLFHQNPHLGLVCTDLEYFQDISGEKRTKKALEGCQKARVFSRLEMIPLFKATEFWIPGLTCIVKSDVLKKYGHLDPYLENISDWFCFHKIALFEGIGYIPDKLISMRLHDKTYTATVKRDKKRKRATYHYLLNHLHNNPEIRSPFQKSGLLTFVFKELYWKLRFNPRYFSYWRHLKKI